MDAQVWCCLKRVCCSVILTMTVSCGQHTSGSLIASKTSPKSSVPPISTSGISKLIGDTPLAHNPNVSVGVPSAGANPEVMISRKQYVISWNHQYRQANFVAWRLSTADMGKVPRQNNFAVDPELHRHLSERGVGRAVEPDEYQGSCFDRGHLIPSADRTANKADNSQTFLMSNMMPQTAHLNRVTWQHLEHHARELVRGTNDTLFIVAGPVFGERPAHIGPDNDIRVPSHNFKIIVKIDENSRPQVLTSVLMPNVTSAGTDPIVDHEQACEDSHSFQESGLATEDYADWERYQTPVTTIEQTAGLELSFLH